MQVLESSSPTIRGTDLDALLTSLKTFSEVKGFQEARAKLVEWATRHNGALRANELQKLLSNFVAEASAAEAVTTINLDGDKCRELLGQLSSPVPDELCASMRSALPYLISQLVTEAIGFLCFVAVQHQTNQIFEIRIRI